MSATEYSDFEAGIQRSTPVRMSRLSKCYKTRILQTIYDRCSDNRETYTIIYYSKYPLDEISAEFRLHIYNNIIIIVISAISLQRMFRRRYRSRVYPPEGDGLYTALLYYGGVDDDDNNNYDIVSLLISSQNIFLL